MTDSALSIPRVTYLEAAASAVDLIGDERVASRWHEESVLPGMTMGVLAAHLGRSLTQVEFLLDLEVNSGVDSGPDSDGGREAGGGPGGTDIAVIDASTYFGTFEGIADRESDVSRGVIRRGTESAEKGVLAVVAQCRETLDRLRSRLAMEPAERRLSVAHRPGEIISLDDYLRTRLVEFAVHTDDLSLSIGAAVTSPPAALAAAVDVLVGAARVRHGDLAVLRALSRRERDESDALHVL
ncbi:maleylpyruvate isomerase N-terminal domain-containing protein [Okibacterium fritillariae]|uniref:Mycothiol maleylpyruvate isomerase N-terminal domain-containing protein n=1 Tax=Okibacterium fritillariae TaxID=123320 RepID=A0A1T5IEK9_9MICO|nr:maleylpyruvate isomerase N-terminal domain-containing protein [Okibacterium fritillariae]SKC37579.1 Mycothiol maleylpyruvate isomerase N-terminal domain-containing protein [Okibacterium fritillariae]